MADLQADETTRADEADELDDSEMAFDGGFRKEVWSTKRELPETGAMHSVWGSKVELAVRTGFAAMLTAVYAVLPQVRTASWQHATVFAPVTAICAVSGPSLGETLHHGSEYIRGALLGALASTVANELCRPVSDPPTREALTWGACMLATLFLTSRPGQPLAQKRFAVGVMLCGTVKMSAQAHNLPWYHPWTITVPCIVGPAAALLAVLLPRPRAALAELRQRAAFHALLQRAVMAEQFIAFSNKQAEAEATADQLLEIVRDNLGKMKELVHAAHFELLLWPKRAHRLKSMVSFFEEQLTIARAFMLTLRKAQRDFGTCHSKFLNITGPHWRAAIKAVAAATDDIVLAEQECRPASRDLAQEVRISSEQLDAACVKARAEVMYQGGAGYAPPVPGEERHLDHCRRIARFFFFGRLAGCTVAFAEEQRLLSFLPARAEPQRGPTLRENVCEYFSCPSPQLFKDSLKKTLAIGLLSTLAWVPSIRSHCPEYIWAFIAASFVMSDYEGSSVSTGLGRVYGTLLGGMFGLECIKLLAPWERLESIKLAASVVCITIWTTACCLFKKSKRHGYLATVSAFSASIMIVGALENSLPSHRHEDLVLQRIEMQSLGAAVYVLVEIIFWPKSARSIVSNQQSAILKTIEQSLAEAAQPHMANGTQSDNTGSDARRTVSKTTTRTNSRGSKNSKKDPPPAVHQGFALVTEATKSVKDVGGEPTMWQKPFPTCRYEMLLHSETRALRITAALHAAVRAVPIDLVDPDVGPLVAGYASAAVLALRATEADLRALAAAEGNRMKLYTPAAHRLLAACGDTIRRPTASSTAAHLLELRLADKLLREGMAKHLHRFVEYAPNENATSYSVNTTFFCCLRFTNVMLELADRLRAIESAETVTISV